MDETLKIKIKELDRRVKQQFKLENRQRQAALKTMNKRLDGMNEFRDSLRDQAGKFATREAVDSLETSTNGRLRSLETFKDNNQGHIDQLKSTVQIVGLVIVIAEVLIRLVWK